LLFFVDVAVIFVIFASIVAAFIGISYILAKRYDSVYLGDRY